MESNDPHKESHYQKQFRMTVLFLSAGMLALLLFCGFLFVSEGRIRTTDPGSAGTGDEVMWEIESLYYDEESHYYTIKGWALSPDEGIETYECHLLLQYTETGAFVQLPGMMTSREDLQERFPELEGSYEAMKSCGFQSVFQRDMLEGELDQYVICIWYQNNGQDILINTKRTLSQF